MTEGRLVGKEVVIVIYTLEVTESGTKFCIM